MAAPYVSYSVDEVIDEVLNSTSGDEEQDVPQSNLGDVIKEAVAKFYPMRRQLINYTHFCEEASQCLENVFRKRKAEDNDNVERVLLDSTSIRPMINSEVQFWIKAINRRMRATPTARSPWSIEFRRDLPEQVFLHIRDAVMKGASTYGLLVENSLIKFTEKKCLVRDFSKLSSLSQSEIRNQLKKSFKQKNFTTEVLVSMDKPFEISFDYRKMKVTVICNYGCWNEFGYGFHG